MKHIVIILFASILSFVNTSSTATTTTTEQTSISSVNTSNTAIATVSNSTPVGQELFDAIKRNDCDNINFAHLSEQALKSFSFPVDPSGLNRYPLHVAIDYQSDKCIRNIMAQVEAFGNDEQIESVLVMHEDGQGLRAVEHAIKNYPVLAYRFTPPNLSKPAVKKLVELAMKEAPYGKVNFLVSLAMRPKIFYGLVTKSVLMALIDHEERDFETTNSFLAYFLEHVKFEDLAVIKKIEIERFCLYLYAKAIETQSMCILASPIIYKMIAGHADRLLGLIARSGKPLVLKLFYDMEVGRFYDKAEVTEEEEMNEFKTELADRIYSRFATEYPVAFQQLPANATALQSIDLYKLLPLVLIPRSFRFEIPVMRERSTPSLKGMNRDEVGAFGFALSEIPEFVYGKIPVAFVIGMYYSPIWVSTMYGLKRDRERFKRPVSKTDPTTPIDLIACYAPSSFIWWLDQEKSSKALKFLLSEKCMLTEDSRAETVELFIRKAEENFCRSRISLLREVLGPESRWSSFRSSLSGSEPAFLLEVVNLAIAKGNGLFALKAARKCNLPVPFSVLRAFLEIPAVDLELVIGLMDLGMEVCDDNDESRENLKAVYDKLIGLLIVPDVNQVALNVLIPRFWLLGIDVNEPLNGFAESPVSLFRFLLENERFSLLQCLFQIEGLRIGEDDRDFAELQRDRSDNHGFCADFAADNFDFWHPN